ncbi:hypothetical protein GCM10022225_42130 [Plantactinospora mayteni]|uniref:Uncharacterized protein n=1 Tax=Plantactinospora mayteni TaxID=566021 RepID=A0ABQ4EUA2_9ACTN|nr:hypothetical protein Pma05_48100 [Plantactinospora mayteni]
MRIGGTAPWYFDCSATDAFGEPARACRGGSPSKAAARRARNEWLNRTGEERTAQGWTLERWLRYWRPWSVGARPYLCRAPDN